MPKVDDYKKGKNKKHAQSEQHHEEHHAEDVAVENETEETTEETKSHKRRPGREEHVEYVDTIHADQHSHHEDEPEEKHHKKSKHRKAHHEEEAPEEEKVRINFPYSELLRAQAPKVFDAAESIATEWKKDGDFSEIEVPNPILKTAAAMGLQRAKKVEKKLEEKGVFLMAKMGIELVKSKLKK